ncbi:hypothetical protein [Mesorhizobium muleiense]|uniref:hypothetical protein n=1 Tax=Mesorhizobium muleiense TaxID=1004279 RepID=UPI001428C79C|nr:hypothetical protein [Mesorhizobium muleiense]MCF6101036.1 hypothetical protein [Mesorhizobium muleiense]
MFIVFVPQIWFHVRFRENPEVPAPPSEPPVAARAFGPLGCKLPEVPRIFFSPKPTRQRALSRLCAGWTRSRPWRKQCGMQINAASMLILNQEITFDCMFILVCAGCFRWVNFAGGLYQHHAARVRALLPIGFELSFM